MYNSPDLRDFDCERICQVGTPRENRDLMRQQGCGYLAEGERDHYENDCCSGEPSDGVCPAWYFMASENAGAVSSAFTLEGVGLSMTLRSPGVLIDAITLVRGARADWRAKRAEYLAQKGADDGA